MEFAFTQRSLVMTLTADKNYDVFIYDNSGTLTLELSAAWASDISRTDALARQDGIWCKSGAATRRWIGTIRASASNQTEDSKAKRLVYNVYNQVARPLYKAATTGSWTVSSSSWTKANNATEQRIEWVQGARQAVDLAQLATTMFGPGPFVYEAFSGIGVDDDAAPQAGYSRLYLDSSAASDDMFLMTPMHTEARPIVEEGFHYAQALELLGSLASDNFTARGETAYIAGSILA